MSWSRPSPRRGTVRARVTDAEGRVATSRHAVTVAPAAGNLPPSVSIVGLSSARTGAPVTLFVGLSTDADSTGALTYALDVDEDGQYDDGTGSQAAWLFADRRRPPGRGARDRRRRRRQHAVQDDRGPHRQSRAAGSGSASSAMPTHRSHCGRASRWTSTWAPRTATTRSSRSRGTPTRTASSTTARNPRRRSVSFTGLHRVYLRGTDSEA